MSDMPSVSTSGSMLALGFLVLMFAAGLLLVYAVDAARPEIAAPDDTASELVVMGERLIDMQQQVHALDAALQTLRSELKLSEDDRSD